MIGVKVLNISRKSWNAGVAISAPIRDNAALILDMEPVNVALASFACSPKASSIAAANVAKSILPLEVISRISPSVLPR